MLMTPCSAAPRSAHLHVQYLSLAKRQRVPVGVVHAAADVPGNLLVEIAAEIGAKKPIQIDRVCLNVIPVTLPRDSRQGSIVALNRIERRQIGDIHPQRIGACIVRRRLAGGNPETYVPVLLA